MKNAPKKNLKLEIHRETLRTFGQPQRLVGIVGVDNDSTLSNCSLQSNAYC